MSESPYQPPEAGGYESVPPHAEAEREKLRDVARYQRLVMWALLASIIINIVGFMAYGQDLTIRLVVLVISLAVVVFAIVAVFLLTKEVANTVAAVICAILMLVPCISLIVLLIVNLMATGYLKRHGVHVGFMGANPHSI